MQQLFRMKAFWKPPVKRALELLPVYAAAMQSRMLVRWYFTAKYKNANPYSVAVSEVETRYVDTLGLLTGMRFTRGLDVGCGEGETSTMLLQICETVDGVDISRSAIERAKANNEAKNNLHFYCLDFLTEDTGEEYELILCAEVLYYFTGAQLERVIEKIMRCLKPRGYLLTGNIKKVNSNRGLFSPRLAADEINERLTSIAAFRVVTKLDRGGDLLLLLRKEEEA